MHIWTAAHNPASPVGTIASAHAASAMRNFRIHELAKYVEWWPDLVVHEGPIWVKGYFRYRTSPGMESRSIPTWRVRTWLRVRRGGGKERDTVTAGAS